ncbi:(R)-benzylsuccinyl-CoA dehydrogenase [Leucobacter aridicollis]|uniref:acyl-CoA dehydrogenase family protein n=1 Tax=Leucobacter aridicollis TaxID=283878 RepID=UPI0037CCABFF
MTGALPEPYEALRLRTRAFIRDVVIPAEPKPGTTLRDSTRLALMQRAKDAGVFAPHLAPEYGGQGVPLEHWPAIFTEAGYSPIGPAVLNCMAPDEGNMHMLELIATDAQKERYLRPLGEGAVRSCFGMTEPHPGAGSDPRALRSSAERVAGGWRINAHKRFISGAEGAAYCILMVRTPAVPDEGFPEGATMLLVDMDHPGVRVGNPINAIDTAIAGGHPHVYFEDCVVGDDAVLGAPGEGFAYAQVRLGPARLTHCMRWLGLAKRAQDIALDRAANRELFGSPLRGLGVAQDMLAQSEIDIATSEAIIDRTAELLDRDPDAGAALSGAAKVHCSDAIGRIIDRAIQICGGDGVTDALPLASYANEVRPFRIYDGSNETHKWAIAKRASSRRRREVEAGAPRLDAVDEHGADTWGAR